MNWPTCDQCGNPVQTSEGAIAISTMDAERAEKAIQMWDESHPGPVNFAEEMSSYPSLAKWMWGHSSCVPEDADYGMEAAKFDSREKALSVTLHMMEKRWIPSTDWISFVRRIHKAEQL